MYAAAACRSRPALVEAYMHAGTAAATAAVFAWLVMHKHPRQHQHQQQQQLHQHLQQVLKVRHTGGGAWKEWVGVMGGNGRKLVEWGWGPSAYERRSEGGWVLGFDLVQCLGDLRFVQLCELAVQIT